MTEPWPWDFEPWEVEIAFHVRERGRDPDKARLVTIIRWMHHGDLRPLAAAILKGHELDRDVLHKLARMILDYPDGRYRVETVPRQRRGRPKDMSKFARDYLASLAYEQNVTRGKSEQTFSDIAKDIGNITGVPIGDRTVRQAVTKRRKKP